MKNKLLLIVVIGVIFSIVTIFYFLQSGYFENNLKKDEGIDSKMRYFSDIDVTIDVSSTAVIVPVFTAAAYSENGFYDFYKGECDDSCLTVKVKDDFDLSHATSRKAISLFHKIGFDLITDIDLERNSSILEKYDKIIVLHNEYVTQNEFNAITNHGKVIYLYPNALYAKVIFDEKEYTISLERGHDFPKGIQNGFDWEYDNTHPYEFDTDCDNWNFYEIKNGYMLNCYPEEKINSDLEFVKKILEI